MDGNTSTPAGGAGRTEPMSAALHDACARVRQIFARNDARDAMDRYAIGCIIRDVRDKERVYGQHSVGRIGRAVGRDVDTLYEYADVAETWSEADVARLLERKTPLGLPLSFTHLVALSKLRHQRDLLKAMTDRALAGISARHLRALIRETRARGGVGSSEEPLACLKRVTTFCDRLLEATRTLDDFLSNLQSLTSTPRLADLLAQSRDAHLSLTRVCQERALQLDAEHTRVRADLEDDGAAEEPETHVIAE